MAGKALIGGALYNVVRGFGRVDGVRHEILRGACTISGARYDVFFTGVYKIKYEKDLSGFVFGNSDFNNLFYIGSASGMLVPEGQTEVEKTGEPMRLYFRLRAAGVYGGTSPRLELNGQNVSANNAIYKGEEWWIDVPLSVTRLSVRIVRVGSDRLNYNDRCTITWSE